MVEHERMNREKKKEPEKESRRRKKAELQYDQFKAADEGIADLIGGPSIDRHAALLTGARSDEQRANLVMQLQQSYGNAYVQRLLNSGAVQAKLTVSQPGDVYEQEADKVAEMIQLQAEPEEEEEEEQEEEIQTQPAESWPTVAPENLETRINNARHIGQPMSESARASFEPQFGMDFSDVRIHTGAEANRLSQQLGAKAFTTGGDVFFREGAYQPESESGKRLLAHELTHVVQQKGGRVHPDTQDRTGLKLTQNTIKRSPSNVIQRVDFLDPTMWDKDLIKAEKNIFKAVQKYQKVRGGTIDERRKALWAIGALIFKWQQSYAKKKDKDKKPEIWEKIDTLREQSEEALRNLNAEEKKQKELEASRPAMEEIAEGVNLKASPAVVAKGLFDGFITWCQGKGIKYNTGSKADPLIAKGGQAYCQAFASSLARLFNYHGIKAGVDTVGKENFTTKALPKFIDPTTQGNLKDNGQNYGQGGCRFFFTEHWVTKVNNKIYDPTIGEIGDDATKKIDKDGFAKDKKKIGGKDEEVYVKDSDWIRIIRADPEVTCGLEGYEYHKGQA